MKNSGNKKSNDFPLKHVIAFIFSLTIGRWFYANIVTNDVTYDLVAEIVMNVVAGFTGGIIFYLFKRRVNN